mgnify:CR=1 FL=1
MMLQKDPENRGQLLDLAVNDYFTMEEEDFE